MSRAAFVARFGGIYEHSPWIAEMAYDRGVLPAGDSVEALADTLAEILANADPKAKLALIRAHPDLAGRAAIAGDLTEASRWEQASAGLDRCTPEEYQRFKHLSEAYKARFGFPFILAVAGRSRHEILAAFEARLTGDAESELRTALNQINRIALFRLRAMALS